ncbi:26S proteasome non-ATPase regulatory subunit 5 [Syngnathus scovelli]|uniref:26S proteasome non-ATPase regulatory subunit 5 n=1 Tax=Syngnathus scovelli TaxID=161590 RepID=UPI00210F9E04|nr:26S proteasome non-ATPase regulatory subunit 5 [Syngnathus scovelli]
MAASIESLLEEISNIEEPIEELQCLKTALLSITVNDLRDFVSGHRFEVIFSLLNSNDREQVELCVDILERILMACSPLQVVQNYKAELQAGLTHPNDTVKILTLTQVGRMADHPDAAVQILNSQDIIVTVIRSIAADNMTVAKQAIQSLTKLARTETSTSKIISGDLLNVLTEVMTVSDIIRYRVYELVVTIVSEAQSHEGYFPCARIINKLIEELTGDDILIRAAAIEMITLMVQTERGQKYLMGQLVFNKIAKMMIDANTDPLSSLYLPGFVKFFGTLSFVQGPQRVCEDYPIFRDKVFEMALDADPTMIGVAMDTLGLLGSTVEGKQVLQKTGEKFKSVIVRMSQLASAGATELRVRCLDAISHLLTLQPEQQTDDLLALTESWFLLLSKQPIDMIRDISTQPFPELHCAALRVFTAIAAQPWGQRLMVRTPGFMEFILDRSISKSKEAKDAKFELVGSLLGSSNVAETLGSQNYISLKTYLREGPYYVSAVAAVDTEGAE